MNTGIKLKNLKLASWNAQGLSNKIQELEHFISSNKVDLILIQETKLNNNPPPKIKNYKYINKPNGPHRGLIIYHKKHLYVQEILYNPTTIDLLGIKINNIHIFNIHANQKPIINTSELTLPLNSNKHVIIAGDFNATHPSWNCSRPNQNGRIIHNFITHQNHNFMLYHPNSDTHIPANGNSPSTIDFVITSNTHISQIETVNTLDSDHLPVIIKINLQIPQEITNNKIQTNINWKSFKEHINRDITITPNIQDKNAINNAIKNLTNTTKNALKKSTKHFTIKNNKLNLPDEIINQINERNKLRKNYQRTRNPNTHKAMKELSKTINLKIKNFKTNQWIKKLNKINTKPQSAWQLASKLNKKHNTNHIFKLHSSNGIVYDEHSKADAIAEQYLNNHLLTDHMSDDTTTSKVSRAIKNLNNPIPPIPDHHLTSFQEIISIINSFGNRKAPGYDGITNLALKHLPRKAIVQILYIINSCLRNNHFPDTWKHAIVLPFLKPGKNKLFPSNYRPISLLPTLSKILERVILNRIHKFEKANKIIIPEQFGFRNNHSTTLQLARIVDQATINFNLNKTTALLTLDIEKAFDTVWHDGLIYKLMKYNFPLHLTKIIQSFLKNRSFAVKINWKTVSQPKPIPAGVPQGSILSPFLFNLFINDIPRNNNTKLALFADDTALIATSFQKTQANKYLQSHINELEYYYDKWKIKVNAEKTKLIHLSKKKDTPKNPITFYNNQIATDKTIKYLGVTLDQKLTFQQHITSATNKARATIKNLFPLLNNTSPINTKLKLTIYKLYTRPIMLYACPIFSSMPKSSLNKLQITQNKALRLILNKKQSTKISTLHYYSNIATIKTQIFNQTHKFFKHNCKTLKITRQIAKYNNTNAPFKIKHKLIHSLLIPPPVVNQ